ncbi:MAG: CBS domain-containing protein [Ardenticatenaceae bacterium]|nr:CBS domain-containing protein [Ardenticatenaceae bacterium]
MKIRQILSRKGVNVITVHPEQFIREAIALLVKHQIGALVVVDENRKPVGILSERDIIRRAAQNEALFSEKVADIMTKAIITGIPQDDTSSVAATMTQKRFRHLPIVEDGDLVGIISIGDILKAERDQYRGEIDTLETRIMAGEA